MTNGLGIEGVRERISVKRRRQRDGPAGGLWAGVSPTSAARQRGSGPIVGQGIDTRVVDGESAFGEERALARRELSPRRSARRETEVGEDLAGGLCFFEDRDQLRSAVAAWAAERVE